MTCTAWPCYCGSPTRYEAQVVRRYGFHSLLISFVLGELTHPAGWEAAQDRVIHVQLGSGASLPGVRDDKTRRHIRTDEGLMIAKSVTRVLHLGSIRET